jgi:hypothetical protein
MMALQGSFTRSSATLWKCRSAATHEMQRIALLRACSTLIELPLGRLRHIWSLYALRAMNGCLPDWMGRLKKR